MEWAGAGAVTAFRYKGYRILARPYQLHQSKRWTVDLEIRRSGRALPVAISARYRSEQEAEDRCAVLGMQIIDGKVPGWSVEQLRGEPWVWSDVVNALPGVLMRQGRIAGIVILCLGAFVLLRGVDLTPPTDLPAVGTLKTDSSGPKAVPPGAIPTAWKTSLK